MNDEPLVSVIIPTYNRAKKIVKSIDSVMNQIYSNWEMLIVDDRSSDNTKEIVEDYIKNDCRIKYFVNNNKKGPAGARNCGIANAKGKYIAFLDSDDQWLNHHLQDSVKVLENENVNVCFELWMEIHSGKKVKVDENPEMAEKYAKAIENLKPVIKDNLIFFGRDFFEYTLIVDCYCYHINTLVFNRKVLSTSGVFNEDLLSSEDVDFIFRILSNYGFCLIRDYHFIYNEGDDNIYAFIDRSKINVDEIVYDKTIVDRLTLNGKYKNESRKGTNNIVKSSSYIKDKKRCLSVTDNRIAEKYFTLGFINRKLNKGQALSYYLQSIKYSYDKVKLLFIIELFCPSIYKKIREKLPNLDYS